MVDVKSEGVNEYALKVQDRGLLGQKQTLSLSYMEYFMAVIKSEGVSDYI